MLKVCKRRDGAEPPRFPCEKFIRLMRNVFLLRQPCEGRHGLPGEIEQGLLIPGVLLPLHEGDRPASVVREGETDHHPPRVLHQLGDHPVLHRRESGEAVKNNHGIPHERRARNRLRHQIERLLRGDKAPLLIFLKGLVQRRQIRESCPQRPPLPGERGKSPHIIHREVILHEFRQDAFHL